MAENSDFKSQKLPPPKKDVRLGTIFKGENDVRKKGANWLMGSRFISMIRQELGKH